MRVAISSMLFPTACACLALAGVAAGQCTPQWIEQNVSGPSARKNHDAVYIPLTGRLVLFGGDNGPGTGFNDTWEWNSTAWSLRTMTGPSRRGGHAMEFEPGTGLVVLHGGYYNGAWYRDTWVWNGSTWTLASTSGPQLSRVNSAIDPITREVLIFGGNNPSTYLDDTWAWNGSSWRLVSSSGPPARGSAAMCLDEARGRVVLFGGINTISILNDTWEWDGASWVQRFPAHRPSPRRAVATYDRARQRVVMFGGWPLTPSAETWSWDGADWTLEATGGPPNVGENSITYGEALGGCLLFGGADAPAHHTDDTWLYADTDNPPTAVAGDDQSIHAGEQVFVDGSASFDDNTHSGSLLYSWAFSSVPAGSTATLADPAAAATSFIADLPGIYVLDLTVTDECQQASPVDQVVISSSNLAPTANAGPDRGAIIDEPLLIDGSESTDPEEDPLTFLWTLVEWPAGSNPLLFSPTTVICAFVPDLPGTYVVELVVDDGFGPSLPDSMEVIAITPEQFAQGKTKKAMDDIEALPPESMTTRGNQKALTEFLTQAIRAIQGDNLEVARMKLEQAIERTDGCALRGQPDGNGPSRDWIVTCHDQAGVYADLTAALDAITP